MTLRRSPREYALLCAATYTTPLWTFAGPTFHAILINDDNENVTLAIQGSDREADWIVDFSIYGPSYYEHPDLGKIHYGANNTTDECLPEIIRVCEGKIVHITGHSKGGFEAEILAAKLVIAGIVVDEVVTFGAPRWVAKGNTKASQWLSGIRGCAYRHFKDVVTQVPFIWWDHPKQRAPIKVGTGRWWQRFNWPAMHHIATYVDNVPR